MTSQSQAPREGDSGRYGALCCLVGFLGDRADMELWRYEMWGMELRIYLVSGRRGYVGSNLNITVLRNEFE